MEYAYIVNGEVVKFPYSQFDFRSDHPNSMVDWSVPEDLVAFGVLVPVVDPVPELDPGETAELSDPIMVEGVCVRQWVITPPDFEAREKTLHQRIDIAAGVFRSRFITDVPGQSQTYAEKEREALAYAADPEGSYPFLTAEAASSGQTLAQVAAEVSATASAWRMLGAAIEGTRIGAKRAVTAAKANEDWNAMTTASEVDWEALLA